MWLREMLDLPWHPRGCTGARVPEPPTTFHRMGEAERRRASLRRGSSCEAPRPHGADQDPGWNLLPGEIAPEPDDAGMMDLGIREIWDSDTIIFRCGCHVLRWPWKDGRRAVRLDGCGRYEHYDDALALVDPLDLRWTDKGIVDDLLRRARNPRSSFFDALISCTTAKRLFASCGGARKSEKSLTSPR